LIVFGYLIYHRWIIPNIPIFCCKDIEDDIEEEGISKKSVGGKKGAKTTTTE